jgi:Glycosyltransferase family 87
VSDRPRGLRDPLIAGFGIAGIAYAIGIIAGLIPYGTDARIWWASRPPDPYHFQTYVSGQPGFFYSPAFAQILAPVTSVLTEPVFVALWTLALLAALYRLVGRWAVVALLFPPVAVDIYAGNIHLLLGLVAVYGFRYPSLWAFALLTKITPGVGLVWFAVRREWRSLAIALGTTAAIVAVSFALAPELWPRWLNLLTANLGADVSYPHIPIPWMIRLPVALVVVAWGAATDRRWVVPVGSMLALPVLWPGSLAMLVAIPAAMRSAPVAAATIEPGPDVSSGR